MPFFDFHIHPTLKCLFSEDLPSEGLKKLSPWVKIDDKNIPVLVKCCTDFQYILESQGNLAQLCNNDCNLICVALYIPEKSILQAKLVQDATRSALQVYLQNDKVYEIMVANPYELLMTDDWNTLTNAIQFGITNRRVKPIKSIAEYNETDDSTIHVVFSVEGCHTLSSALQNFDVTVIKNNIDNLRSNVSLISINLTHMESSPLCNQAYGILFLSDDIFRPTGNGIAAGGIEILRHCYENKIMIDIKHMSLGARQQLYTLRQSPEFTPINQPIICTHAGFTGISQKEIADYIYIYQSYPSKGYSLICHGKPTKYGDTLKPSFNASSINLYDEDIIQVLTSGGMIGLSLDKRILGYQEYQREIQDRDDYPLETDFISIAENKAFFGTNTKVEIGIAFQNNQCLEWDDIAEGGMVKPSMAEYHLTYFMAHILHLIVVAKNNGYDVQKALTQVCIGSDFDGLINPVWICSTADDLSNFKDQFTANFIAFANASSVALPDDFDIKRFSDMLFFENGKDFILNRLSILAH